MTRMHNPAHPGKLVRSILEELDLQVTTAAEQLGVNRVTLSRLINEQSGVSPDMAIRLEQWLNVDKTGLGPDADMWMRMQTSRDLWEARQRSAEIRVVRTPMAA